MRMYKYKCSKDDCKSTWTAEKGTLNGFILTCPVCGKGRGVFESQDDVKEIKIEYVGCKS